jgi:hypothetical protein
MKKVVYFSLIIFLGLLSGCGVLEFSKYQLDYRKFMKNADEEGYVSLYQHLILGLGDSKETIENVIHFEFTSTVDFDEEIAVGSLQMCRLVFSTKEKEIYDPNTCVPNWSPTRFKLEMSNKQLYMISNKNGYLQYDLLDDETDNQKFNDYIMSEYSVSIKDLTSNFEEVEDNVYRVTVNAIELFDPDDFSDEEELSEALSSLDTIDLLVTFDEEFAQVTIEIDEFFKIEEDEYLYVQSTMIQEGIDEMETFNYDNNKFVARPRKEDFGFPIYNYLDNEIYFNVGMNYVAYYFNEGTYDLDYTISDYHTMALVDEDGELIIMEKGFVFTIEKAQVVYFALRVSEGNGFGVSTIMSVRKQ